MDLGLEFCEMKTLEIGFQKSLNISISIGLKT